MLHTRYTCLLLTASAALMLVVQPAIASDQPLTDEVPAEPITTEVSEDALAVESASTTQATAIGLPIDLDRSAWPALIVTPADGSVTHNPHYMGNVPLGEDEVSPLHAPDPVWQIQEALRGADAGNYNGENLAALCTQPAIGLAQFVLIPVHAVFEHPWAETTSP